MILELLLILFFFMLLMGDFELLFYYREKGVEISFNGIFWLILYKLINIDKSFISIHKVLK